MRRKVLVIFLGVFVGLFLYIKDEVYAGNLINKTKEGYLLYIPQKVLRGKSASILICLPGWGVSPQQDINNWKFPAEKNNFIIIDFDVNYPSIIRFPYRVRSLYTRINKAMHTVISLYRVEKRKRYIAGTSAGGMMAITLGLMYPKEFIAVGVISGARLEFGAPNYLRNAKNKKFYIVHGKKDSVVPIRELYSTVKELNSFGAEVKFDIIPEGSHTLPSYVYKDIVDWFLKQKR